MAVSIIQFKVEKGRVLVPVGVPCPFGCKYCSTRSGEVGPPRVKPAEILSHLREFAAQHAFTTIQFGYDKLPSRYPPGYPILMIPWLRFLPHNGILAPFRTNQTIGLLLLAATFVFYLAIGKPIAGGFADLLVATQPAFVSFSRSSMSDDVSV